MKISIVIPAFNEEKLLSHSLDCVRRASAALSERHWAVEFIVCDNNSNDRTAEMARAAGAQVVFEPINQIGRARNTGARKASGDWIIFVDADSCPSAALFADVARSIASGRVLGGGATIRMDHPGLAGLLLVKIWNVISRLFHWAAGSFIFCEASAFHEIGGFNLNLFAAEEIDFSKRLKRLAKVKGRGVDILYRNPLITSGRKLHLFSFFRHFRFFARAALFPKRTLQNREACSMWYDGSR